MSLAWFNHSLHSFITGRYQYSETDRSFILILYSFPHGTDLNKQLFKVAVMRNEGHRLLLLFILIIVHYSPPYSCFLFIPLLFNLPIFHAFSHYGTPSLWVSPLTKKFLMKRVHVPISLFSLSSSPKCDFDILAFSLETVVIFSQVFTSCDPFMLLEKQRGSTSLYTNNTHTK